MDEMKEKWLKFFAYAAELAITSDAVGEYEISWMLGYKNPNEPHSEFYEDYVKYFELIFGREPLME